MTKKLFSRVHFILSQKKFRRDYRSVEKNCTTFRMPSGMRPEGQFSNLRNILVTLPSGRVGEGGLIYR